MVVLSCFYRLVWPKKKSDSYQDGKAIVQRVISVIYNVTGIAITYFIQLANKEENSPLIKNFIT